jgi:hypothetical protein
MGKNFKKANISEEILLRLSTSQETQARPYNPSPENPTPESRFRTVQRQKKLTLTKPEYPPPPPLPTQKYSQIFSYLPCSPMVSRHGDKIFETPSAPSISSLVPSYTEQREEDPFYLAEYSQPLCQYDNTEGRLIEASKKLLIPPRRCLLPEDVEKKEILLKLSCSCSVDANSSGSPGQPRNYSRFVELCLLCSPMITTHGDKLFEISPISTPPSLADPSGGEEWEDKCWYTEEYTQPLF